MYKKCAILSAIGAPLLVGFFIGIIWLCVSYKWVAISLGVLSGVLILFMVWLGLYETCKDHHKRKMEAK